jgi:CheY-like chemotaxis protein
MTNAHILAPATGGAEEVMSGGNETILLVDDEESILEVGRSVLTHYGYTVVTAASGEAALEAYRTRPGEIDLVVLDLGMPGMGGRKCLTELFAFDPRVKVLIASGYSADAQVKSCLAAGALGFLAKPYQFREMLKKIREVLEKPRPD